MLVVGLGFALVILREVVVFRFEVRQRLVLAELPRVPLVWCIANAWWHSG